MTAAKLDGERVAALYRRYGPIVYRRCVRLLRDREEARDATQEVFIKLMRAAQRMGGRGLSIRWMYRVTTNHCLNLLQRARRAQHEPLEPHLDAGAASRASAPANALLARAVLRRFDGVTQAVAMGVLVGEMEHEEVAALLGVSERTVGRKRDRFLADARKFLARDAS